jgi:hypothetical protein
VFFLITVLVEKILRVQPDVKKIYLPVRAADAAAAKRRVETEVCIFLSILSPVKHARRQHGSWWDHAARNLQVFLPLAFETEKPPSCSHCCVCSFSFILNILFSPKLIHYLFM